jgi:uncharacterized membrane protein YdjX (TVP38/TMEM64 family)
MEKGIAILLGLAAGLFGYGLIGCFFTRKTGRQGRFVALIVLALILLLGGLVWWWSTP